METKDCYHKIFQDTKNAFEIIKFVNQNIETYLAKTPQLVISLENVNKEMLNAKCEIRLET